MFAIQVNDTHVEFQNTLTVTLSKEHVISRRDLKVIWKCAYPRFHQHRAHMNTHNEWWGSTELTRTLNALCTHNGVLLTWFVVGSPSSPCWSSTRPCSWPSPWICSQTVHTYTNTSTPFYWARKTPCSSRWLCRPTALLHQACFCRWSPAGPPRALTRKTLSRGFFFRMGILWYQLSVILFLL